MKKFIVTQYTKDGVVLSSKPLWAKDEDNAEHLAWKIADANCAELLIERYPLLLSCDRR